LTQSATEARSLAYRPDVDGLRAIAVLLVLLFHCQFATFAGGFIGVDVFFVISGFLISSLILADLRKGTFSFYQFYARRIRRLFPALLVTVLLSMALAVFVLAPDHLIDAAKSGGLATISLSNFYFAMAASYFDPSAQSKPFLHMWSLSLEEQFYLFWPFILFLLYRWKRTRLIFALVAVGIPIGLALSQFWITKNPNHAYFLLPFRGFQFLAGAACIWLSQIDIRSRGLSQTIWTLGIALILVPAVVFSEATPFPGLAAAIPTLGSMLVIWQGQRLPLQRVLGNPWMVWFGKISYSTYLVHWPVVVFWLYLSVTPPSTAEKVALFILSVAAGQTLDTFVAQRFRYPRSEQQRRWVFPAAQTSLVAFIGLTCGVVVATGGLPARFTLVPSVSEYRNASLFPFLRDYGDGVLHLGSPGRGRVLIFGDSMAQNYIPAILQLDGIRNAEIDIVSRGGCVLARTAVLVNYHSPDENCVALRDQVYRMDGQYDLVIWSQNWLGYGPSLNWETDGGRLTPAFVDGVTFDGWRVGVETTLAHFEPLAKKIVVIGPQVPVTNVNPIISRIGPLTDIAAVSELLGAMREVPTESYESMKNNLRALVATRPKTLYIDPHSMICSDRHCRLSDGQFSYYLDSLHNTSAAIPTLRQGLERAGLTL